MKEKGNKIAFLFVFIFLLLFSYFFISIVIGCPGAPNCVWKCACTLVSGCNAECGATPCPCKKSSDNEPPICICDATAKSQFRVVLAYVSQIISVKQFGNFDFLQLRHMSGRNSSMRFTKD